MRGDLPGDRAGGGLPAGRKVLHVRHRRRHLSHRQAIGIPIFAAIAYSALLLSLFHASVPEQSTCEPANPALHVPGVPHRVYPYSVIRGGALTSEELRDTVDNDPVVAAHYEGFDYARFQIVRPERERLAYVSYRIGDEIYWTGHRLRIRANEELLTDGVILARTRCGNQISMVPRLPVAPVEPPIMVMETPEKVPLPSVPSPTVPVKEETRTHRGSRIDLLPPLYYAVIWGRVRPKPTPPRHRPHPRPLPPIPHPIEVTPEPGTLWTFGSALAIIVLGWYWKKRKTS